MTDEETPTEITEAPVDEPTKVPTEERAEVTEEERKKKLNLPKIDMKEIPEKTIGLIKNLYQRGHDWLWGTKEHPNPPFSKRGKFRRWFLIHYRGYVNFIRTWYDRENDEYVYDKVLIKRSEVPREAVHVTGEKFTWHVDEDLIKRGFSSDKDNGFTAVDALLYMKCNKIDEAMMVPLDAKPNVPMQKVIAAAAIAFGVFLAIYFMMMQ